MIEFFAPDIEAYSVLPEIESGHCIRVLRKKSGDTICATDGKGHRFTAMITDPHPKHTGLEILQKQDVEKGWQGVITLAVAPTKSIDRMEWLVEKCVELGIDRIIFLKCERSERKQLNEERLRKIAVSAMKQSLKAHLPEITGMTDIKEVIASTSGLSVFGYCSPDFPKTDFRDIYRKGCDITIFIGPEGDFSPDEVKAATEAGIIPVTFGNNRLRTETAAIYGVTATHILQ